MVTNDLLKKKNEDATYVFHANPLVRKLRQINERSEDAVTYQGVVNKIVYFLAMLGFGVVVAYLLQSFSSVKVIVENGELMDASLPALILMGVCLLLMIIVPFIAFFIRSTIPVTGTIYCMATGYVYALLPMMLPEYASYIALALVITVAIVAAMGFLFARGLVKVTQKFKAVLSTLFAASILTSLLMLIAFLIPATRPLVIALADNWLLSVGGAIAYVVIAAMFLLVDFSTIQEAVEQQLPVKYEWMAAFSLTFSVIWLFMKVLDLILRLNKKD